MSNPTPLAAFAEFLASSYRGGTGDASAVTVLFEPVGHPITQADVSDESFSSLADQYPSSGTGPFFPALTRLSSVYQRLLGDASSAPPASAPTFDRMKAQALANLEASKRAPMSPVPIPYLGSNANPADWFAEERYWQTYESGGLSRVGGPLHMMVAERPFAGNDLAWTPAADSLDIAAADMVPARSPTRGANPVLPELPERMAVMRALDTEPVAATTPSLRLKLKFCVVRFQRPWLDSSLFWLYQDWFVPGLNAGQMTGPPTRFSQLPMALVVVRDFSAQADWSAEDAQQVGRSAGLGPFSLAGATWAPNSGSLSNAATQIIGWICLPLPSLPPLSDPATVHSSPRFIEIEHAGWYVARFEVTWEEPSSSGGGIGRSWSSGLQLKGFVYRIEMSATANKVAIRGWAVSGGAILSIETPQPTDKRYRVGGTTLKPRVEVLPAT